MEGDKRDKETKTRERMGDKGDGETPTIKEMEELSKKFMNEENTRT